MQHQATVGAPARARQNPPIQLRAANWTMARRLEDDLKREGYRFTDNLCASLRPGQYTGKPLGDRPGAADEPRLWLVAWRPRPVTGPQAPQVDPRLLAAFDAILERTRGFGLLVAGLITGALGLRYWGALADFGGPIPSQDWLYLFGGFYVAFALAVVGLRRVIPVLARACGRGNEVEDHR